MRGQTREMWEVNKYLWFCLAFIGLFIPAAHALGWLSVSIPVAYGVFALALLNGALRTYFGWRSGGSNDQRGWIFTIVDVALISTAVRVTGGLASEIWLLYFVLLVSESLFANNAQAMTLSAVMGVGYIVATWPGHTDRVYWAAVATRLFFLGIVSAFARRISGDRERRNLELADLREQVGASEERRRIAREVHDSLGHALVASILRLELSLRLIPREPAEAASILREELAALRAAWNEGRNLAFHLRPWEREEGDLVANLRRHAGRFAERTGLAVDLDAPEKLELASGIELALTRIVQEALTNVARHAQGTRVAIHLAVTGRQLCCDISDDGVGFDPDACAGSFGLSAMRERAEKAGGHLTIASRPGAGSRLHIELPCGGV